MAKPQLVLRLMVSMAVLVVCGSRVHAQLSDSFSDLIDELTEIPDMEIAYLPTKAGGEFLPLGYFPTTFSFQKHTKEADALSELVRRGAAAVPHLIAHLDDNRLTKMVLNRDRGFRWMFFPDEYDYNSRTSKQPPSELNRDPYEGRQPFDHYTVTVGDFCFIALGQIVNRSFNAVRYQHRGSVMINSPTHSERLRIAIKEEWGGLTPERHRERLIRDFVEPDSEARREGACLRLGFYYRDELESFALRQLSEPRYDIIEVGRLIREQLYRAKDVKDRKALFDGFIANHNEVARQGILEDLFSDLEIQEHGERGTISPPVRKGEYAARECLIELFGYPKDVKSTDRPFLLPLSHSDQARFIDMLSRFPSPKIDQAVRDVLHSADDDYLASACIQFLIGRGADADIRKYVEKHMPGADEKRREELTRLLNQVGWTPLHAAAATFSGESKLELLLRAGADVNAIAANGQTPLHVAANHERNIRIRILLKYNANPNIKDNNGKTPVQLVGGFDAVDDLIAADAEIPDILVAAIAGRADLVKNFLKNDKAAVDSREASTGNTPLHLAVLRGHVEVAEVLLAHGAGANVLNGPSNTHRRFTDKPPRFWKLLFNRHANPWSDSYRRSPKDLAREQKDERMIRLFDK